MLQTPDSSSLRRTLVADLVSRGLIRSPEWRDVFERVPRHVFVHRFYAWSFGDALPAETVAVADDPERWLPWIYSDVVLPTEMDRENGRWLSSSSKPSMMAVFLEALDVRDGHSVLEIGTGSGYNAALLCERLGSGRVTTVDIRPQLIADARARLAECGYEPTIAVADGAEGYPPCAPYDRIVATCSVHRIPDAWIDQVAPEGVIVTPLKGGRFTEGLAVLRKDPDDTLQGRLRPERVWFMPLEGRDAPTADAHAHALEALATPGSGVARRCIVPPWLKPDAEDVFDPAFLLRVQLPDATWLSRGESELVIASAEDGSWARVMMHPDGPVVEQGGERNLWDVVESSYRLWLQLGRPRLRRYGITITADRRQYLWLDDPESEHRWDLGGSV